MRLPVDDFLPQMTQELAKAGTLIVVAAPGGGKTTRLPPALLSQTEKQVWVLEPRRIAAIAASSRIALENGWVLGQEVGYQVRFDHRSSAHTRLLFMTEALLLRKLLQDPDLSQVGIVVLDEFHERSLHVDLALAALKELRELSRPDLQIVVMSATLDAAAISRYLDQAPVVEVPGRLFELTTHYEDKVQLLRTGPDFTERLRKLVQRAMNENPEGDLLCFLPGKGEITRLREALLPWAGPLDIAVETLHGSLGLQDQKAALEPRPGRLRKIVLSTNVAESSLTVAGVRLVVDSGLVRTAQLHPRTGFESLDLVRISKASAQQRAGRAARTGPGHVYRAWTPHDELSMKEFELAEIMRSDLSETLLMLAGLGIRSFGQFSWFEDPPSRTLGQAEIFLKTLGALTAEGMLTPLGNQLLSFPLHPRLAKLLITGQTKGDGARAADLAALLSEQDSRSTIVTEAENDVLVRWEEWKRTPTHPKNRGLNQSAEQLKSLVTNQGKPSAPPPPLETWIPEILFEVYKDRLCRRRQPREPQAKMVGGRGVRLHPQSSVKTSEYFLALSLSEGRDQSETLIFQAVGLPTALVEKQILPLATPQAELEWEDEKNRFVKIESKTWNQLPIGNEHRRPALADEIQAQLIEVAKLRWPRILSENTNLEQWFSRLRFLNRANANYPLLTNEDFNHALEMACFGETSLEHLVKKDLTSFFESCLTPEHRKALTQDCPTSWTVPTGNQMAIHYSEDQGPKVEVRLQELFGLKESPKIAGQFLTLVLLGPNYRPVQVTRDLASFWKSGYIEVRKELRTRYPKHSWPDDPLTATAQARGRARK